MANRIYAKDRPGKNAFYMGALQANGFQKLTLVINQANTAVQDFFIVPWACKIPLVTIACDTASPGITAFNVAIGTVAEAGALLDDNSDVSYPPQTNTVAGVCLFQNAGNTAPADQAVTLVAGVPQTFPTSLPNAIFPQNTYLTLRIVTGGVVAGTIKTALTLIPVDIKENNPLNSVFSWATSLG